MAAVVIVADEEVVVVVATEVATTKSVLMIGYVSVEIIILLSAANVTRVKLRNREVADHPLKLTAVVVVFPPVQCTEVVVEVFQEEVAVETVINLIKLI